MSRTASYYDLRDALSQPGCPVCRLMARDTERYLDGLLWESVNDPGVRHKLREALGFCHQHAWQLNRAGASLGVAILMHDVLGSVLGAMESAHFQAPPALSLRRAHESLDSGQPAAATADLVARLTARVECAACIHVGQMEQIYLSSLNEHLLGEDGLLAAYEVSDGLCLPHFRRALISLREEAVFHALLAAQRTVWGRLVEHLSEFIRKNDARFRDEPWGDERDAWLRALGALTGARRDEARD
jgi:hypothetical protein